MKPILQIASLASATLALAACNDASAPQKETGTLQDVETTTQETIVAPEDVMTPVLENKFVRVLKFDIAPGVTLAEHEGHGRLVYSLTEYTLKWLEEGHPETTKSWKPGDIHAHKALRHGLTNVGETPAKFIVIERTDAVLPDNTQAPADTDAAGLDHDHANALFDNDTFRVVKVTLAPGESQPAHDGGWRVIYSLTDYTIEWHEDEAAPVQKSWMEGQAHWHHPSSHSAKNIGETTAEWLVVTLKK